MAGQGDPAGTCIQGVYHHNPSLCTFCFLTNVHLPVHFSPYPWWSGNWVPRGNRPSGSVERALDSGPWVRGVRLLMSCVTSDASLDFGALVYRVRSWTFQILSQASPFGIVCSCDLDNKWKSTLRSD